ncbi:MAG TPA: hypothetical protein VLH08_17625 [Acidobacteriota bacterium]|jgi:hypothetical protein|nr:hypothetical protein [Acidobacteriota bacterium]
MTTSVLVDEKALKLNPFMSNLTGNIILCLANSLKAAEGKHIEFTMQENDLQLFIDSNEVPLDLGHAKQIVGNILQGLLKSLHGAEAGQKFRFICEQ